jgi:hypothetical protein
LAARFSTLLLNLKEKVADRRLRDAPMLRTDRFQKIGAARRSGCRDS